MKAEIMANRRTFNDIGVQFWTDGAVTTGLHATYVRGCGISRSNLKIKDDVQAAWLLAGEVAVYDYAELAKAVQVARRAVRQRCCAPLHYFRQIMAGKKLHKSMNPMGAVNVVWFEESA